MEKVRLQILVDAEDYAFLNSFCIEYLCKNNSEALKKLIERVKRLQSIVSNLEKVAWKQKEIDKPAEKQIEKGDTKKKKESYYEELERKHKEGLKSKENLS